MPKWKCSNCHNTEKRLTERECRDCGKTGLFYPVEISTNDVGRDVGYKLEHEEFYEKGIKQKGLVSP